MAMTTDERGIALKALDLLEHKIRKSGPFEPLSTNEDRLRPLSTSQMRDLISIDDLKRKLEAEGAKAEAKSSAKSGAGK